MSETSDTNETLLRLPGWALVLGASSGFGAAVALQLARAGCNIFGVHLDRHATMPNVERIIGEIEAMGRKARFFNVNAADDDRRHEVCQAIINELRPAETGERLRVVFHSLAFGSLKPYVAEKAEDEINSKQLRMTCDVMAHSLVFWVQDLCRCDLLRSDARIFAMTSTGSWAVWQGYGAVSAAKAALEAHIRQLAVELGPRGITVNAICAGVTDTPAQRKIPDHTGMVNVALRKNPRHRLTRPEDVAAAVVALAQPCTYWMNGNVINVDGGEAAAG